ncbi:DUF4292 domain-containing protein [Flexithrix dorotheae]|uniref:DUF4292 domain-containing protein n=1 Tax=Flexithrix dorotheae TaxID=70993 RepID=UPI0003722861|nr:DUF4292 domain-containing protein [Flexithrix dorotheae]
MKNVFQKIFLFSALISLALFSNSCKKTEATSSIIAKKAKVKELDYALFTAKGKLKIEQGDTKQRVIADVRMKKDSIIWLSMKSPTGIEGARLLATPDSVVMLDRLNNVFYAYTFPEISRILKFDLNLPMLQSIVVGNALVFDEGNAIVTKDDTHKILSQLVNNIKIESKISKSTSKLEEITVENFNNRNQLQVEYSNFKEINNRLIAHSANALFTFRDEAQIKSINFEVNYTRTGFDGEELNFPFKIPRKFKQAIIDVEKAQGRK